MKMESHEVTVSGAVALAEVGSMAAWRARHCHGSMQTVG